MITFAVMIFTWDTLKGLLALFIVAILVLIAKGKLKKEAKHESDD